MKRLLEYALVAALCVAAVAAAGRYVLRDGGPAAKPATEAQKAEEGHKDEGKHGHDEPVKMSDAQVAAAGIELLTAGPRELQQTLRLNGLVQPNQETLVKVTSRFPGVIRSMRKRLGDPVRKDEVLATVESNQSLTTFELKAPMDGTVIDRDGTLGEFASEQKPLFTVADLSTMWVDFAVYRRDFGRVRAGDRIVIDLDDGGAPVESRIDYVSPIGASDTQSAVARAVVPNGGRLRAGLFVTGRVVLSARPAAVVVAAGAVQTLEGKTVVFRREEGGFAPREVVLGERDADWAEVRSGLAAGDVYAGRNSFVIKAEIGKGSAAHED
ncbi:MAG: efflux RND transporter periplasmic adaptor subunit [Proteobacteria bacterium]|nr:efflux RND transporter periplasmic adaptor subunit [Pseudomonadota bacterium]